MLRRPHLPLLGLLAAAALAAAPAAARASGGNYVLAGGTPAEQAQVRAALQASSFDWGLVPQQVTIHIGRGVTSDATPGQIWLDAGLLDAGSFSWGVVQHEYAHQVDFLLVDGAQRAELQTALGGVQWWPDPGRTVPHAQLGCERFASTLAWAYWPSPDNAMRPQSRGDESAAMQPAAFRALLARLIGAPASTRTVAAHRPSPARGSGLRRTPAGPPRDGRRAAS